MRMSRIDGYLADIDARTLEQAHAMIPLTAGHQILEYFASIDPRMAELYKDSPYAAALGRAQALMGEMVAIINRQRARIEEWDLAEARGLDPLADVDMVCTSCRQPVTLCSNDRCSGHWKHVSNDIAISCQIERGDEPVKAMVAAGNEKIPVA